MGALDYLPLRICLDIWLRRHDPTWCRNPYLPPTSGHVELLRDAVRYGHLLGMAFGSVVERKCLSTIHFQFQRHLHFHSNPQLHQLPDGMVGCCRLLRIQLCLVRGPSHSRRILRRKSTGTRRNCQLISEIEFPRTDYCRTDQF